jgi:phytoene dehydrogenase-like protein
VTCATAVTEVVVRGGRAVAVRTADGTEVDAGRAVLADVDAPTLLLDLVGAEHLPGRVLDDLRRFEWDTATFKVDWALDGPIPWTAPAARRAATVHVSDTLDELSRYFTDVATGAIPARPFLLFGQQAVADPSRCPPGKGTGWAYTHVPRRVRADAGGAGITGAWTAGEMDAFAERIEARVEELAPGFRALIRGRHLLSPAGFEAADANLRGGAIGGGTQQLHQQLVFRPTAGLGRPDTPLPGLFLAGASAHPGAGVHGACGANAARAALSADRLRRLGQPLARLRRISSRPSASRTS